MTEISSPPPAKWPFALNRPIVTHFDKLFPVTKAVPPQLILASASPRRKSLLAEAGFVFVVQPSKVDEEAIAAAAKLPAPELAVRLALAKARDVAARFPDAVVLGADTVVALDVQILGKPINANHARQMLASLSGTTHRVITGVAVVRQSTNHSATACVASIVKMRPLTPDQIDRYIAGGQWRGKAGGYGIQDVDPFVETEGCQTNIAGLPMTTTAKLLADAIKPSF
jgi:septum formation protein